MTHELDLILAEVKYWIGRGDINTALLTLRSWVSKLACDHRLIGRVWGSAELDALCLDIGERALSQKGLVRRDPADSVFVGSEFYKTGGHTTLVEEYIRALPDRTTRILVTDPANCADHDSIIARLGTVCSDIRFSPVTASLADKLNWLIGELQSSAAAATYFVHHPDDPIAVACMNKSLCTWRAFVHHVDHTFTLGTFVDVEAHLDFRRPGFANCREHLGIRNNVIVPLTVPDRGPSHGPARSAGSGSKLTTCTSGDGKFEIPYAFQLVQCIPDWLEATGGRHIHIGGLSPETVEALQAKLVQQRIAMERFLWLPRVESLWQALLDNEVDIYIDSFPVCGCTALVEAMGAGIPVAVHRSYVHRLLSGETGTYEGAFVWSSRQELSDWLRSVDDQQLQVHRIAARQYYLDNHLPASVGPMLPGVTRTFTNRETATHPLHRTDGLRAFLDCFPTPARFSNSMCFGDMLRLVALVEAMDLPEKPFVTMLSRQVAPATVERYQRYRRELKRRLDMVAMIQQIYPVLNNGELDRERFSRLLFSLCQLAANKRQPLAATLIRRLRNLYHTLSIPSVD